MRAFLLTVLLCTSAWTADAPAQALFDKARELVLANADKVPRYTCVETVTRTLYHPQYGNRPESCPALITARANAPDGLLLWHDRLRLDVAVGNDGEMFSWAGASSFDTNDIDQLAGSGSAGSGAFSSFLLSVFGRDPDRFVYDGVETGLAVFSYRVPLARSHYSYRMNSGTDRIIAYRGKFYLVPGTAELKRLTVEATEFPSGDVCHVQDRMDYHTTKIGAGDFMLPEVSAMTVLFKSGDESINETRFSGCHEYVGEATIHFDEDTQTKETAAAVQTALRAMPPKTRVRARLETPLNSSTAAAGDPITALVDRDNGPVRKGDRLHGRVLRLEQYMTPYPRWVLALRFDSIERNGVDQPVTLRPVDDGERTAPPTLRNRILSVPLPTEPRGAGIYGFNLPGALVLDNKFRSEWEVAR